MASQSSIAVLRRLEIFAFPPAFILLIAHGIASECAFPALGLLPLAASAVLATFILNRDVVAAIGSPIQSLSESNIFWADCLLAIFHLSFLIPSWALLTQVWPDPLIALGAYCTVFMMFDLRSCNCPHCRTVAKTGYFSSTVSEYTPLSDGDGETEPEIIARDIEEGNRNVHL
ncbi:uncharacterized protein ColSpa_05451 [Colletotrichum spaethianum]|uniref:Uncharacterized protein n=1 Tax=Colletotrichum spaethianum TaxID=700344 RepID=A0AA37LEU8_9PEZI|nr:uncharacterized protein ColSpa_05451 [Colletotrichum spaethianum]GKT45270.1 hypothetical protein ColSpa_05451 [Colletotrichum spaethianum]